MVQKAAIIDKTIHFSSPTLKFIEHKQELL